MCEYVLHLHRIGQLNKDWWKNDVDLTGEREKMYVFHISFQPRKALAEYRNESRDTEPHYKTWAPNHVRCYPPPPERSRRMLELRQR